MSQYTPDAVDHVREGNDIVSVISQYVRLQKKGTSYVGLCPFHKEKSPSLNVNEDRQLFHCFGCGAGGNVIQFVMRIENYGFLDAVKLLADKINYAIEEDKNIGAAKANRELKEKLLEIHKKAARFFYDSLNAPEGKAAAEYLDKRGVAPQIRRKYGLGYCPSGKLYNLLEKEGYSKDVLSKTGLFAESGGRIYDRFYGRLMFPIFDARGDVIAFGGRLLEDNDRAAKYLNSPETAIFSKSKNLYSINFARKEKSSYVILAEGYMDVISLHQFGFRTAVAALGTAFNEKHVSAIDKICQTIVLLFDSDEAGQKAANRAIDVLRNSKLEVKVVKLKDAKDPDEFLKKFGAQAFAEQLQNASADTKFLIENAKNRYNLSEAEGKVKFAAETAQILSKIESLTKRDIYGKEAAELAGVDEKAIKAEVEKIARFAETSKESQNRKTMLNAATSAAGKHGVFAGVDTARRFILRVYADKAAYDAPIEENLVAEEFCVDVYIKLFGYIKNDKKMGVSLNAGKLLGFFDEQSEQETISNLLFADIFCDNEARMLNDCIREVKKAYCQEVIITAGDDLAKATEFSKKRREVETKTFVVYTD